MVARRPTTKTIFLQKQGYFTAWDSLRHCGLSFPKTFFPHVGSWRLATPSLPTTCREIPIHITINAGWGALSQEIILAVLVCAGHEIGSVQRTFNLCTPTILFLSPNRDIPGRNATGPSTAHFRVQHTQFASMKMW